MSATESTPATAPTPLMRVPVIRYLALATLVSTFGNGLLMTLSALYFTRIVGLSTNQFGIGLTVVGVLGVVVSVRAGPLTDRLGARRMLLLCLSGQILATFALVLVHSFWQFLVVMAAGVITDRAAATARAALYAHALPPELRTRARAFMRAITNAGIGAGAASAGVVLHIDTRAAYVTAILIDAATYVLAAFVLARLPITRQVESEQQPEPRRRRRNPALRDLAFLSVAALNAVVMLQFSILEIGVPLWIVGHTHAPRVMVASVMLINTVLVVALQMRAARDLASPGRAALVLRRGCALLAVAWVLVALCSGLSAVTASILIVAAMVVETGGEVLTAAAGWELSYSLADENHHGAYQGVFQGGFAAMSMLGPVIVTSSALHFGVPGWLFLAGVFAAAGLVGPPIVRWAHRVITDRVTLTPGNA